MSNWEHKDVWHRRGTDFMVEIKRHSVPTYREYDSEGPHRWCVYAYIYPKHPHFAAFKGDETWQDAASALHFHGGCTYLEYPTCKGRVASVKVGADYHHLHDDHFTHYDTPELAEEVFADADELFMQLQTIAEVKS